MSKSADAFRTISEVAEELDLPQHVLRFWETRFKQIKPMKRGGGRRYYRPDDVELLKGIRHLLYAEGYTIKGVQRILKEQGNRHVMAAAGGVMPPLDAPQEQEQAAVPVAQMASLSPSSVSSANAKGDLQAVLTELLECKRLLDQVR
ncbi:MAG: MerR family transcriptional regulator [Pseudomonadota bacterium]